jgi:hypothetical protein
MPEENDVSVDQCKLVLEQMVLLLERTADAVERIEIALNGEE